MARPLARFPSAALSLAGPLLAGALEVVEAVAPRHGAELGPADVDPAQAKERRRLGRARSLAGPLLAGALLAAALPAEPARAAQPAPLLCLRGVNIRSGAGWAARAGSAGSAAARSAPARRGPASDRAASTTSTPPPRRSAASPPSG
jgi:hypothetical protein